MKKSIILAAIAVVTLASCSKDQNTNNESTLTPIALSGSALNVDLTRGPIEENTAFDAQIVASATSGNYASVAFSQPATFAADGKTTLNPVQNYDATGARTYIKGFAPKVGSDVTLNGNTVEFKVDGNQDIMVANEISGSKTDVANKNLVFEHTLTQLQFEIVGETADATTAWGAISSIEIVNQPSVFELNLSNNTLSAGTKPIGIFALNTPKNLTTTPVEVGVSMIAPVNSAISLKVTTAKGVINVTIPQGSGYQKGSAYKVKLKFAATATVATPIVVTGSVTPWKNGVAQEITIN